MLQILSMYYYLKEGKLSTKEKGWILIGLGYLISPIDIIPDTIPILGFSDDITVLKFIYGKVQENI